MNNDLVSFQNGVDQIADGCTTYGSTPSSNTPSKIVEAIKSIYNNRYNAGVTATKKGNASAANVLSGKTFTNASSVNISGTMTDNGAISKTITPKASTQSYTIPAGYHNGSGKVTVNAAPVSLINGTATAANVLEGKTFFSDSYTAKTGTMTNNGAVSKTITPSASTQSYTIPAGYHNGSGKVTVNAANIAAPLNNWQIGGSKTGSGFNEEYLVGNRLFTLTQANNGYLSLILTTNRACYLTIVKYVGTYGNAAGTYTATVIKKNAYTAAGYKYESPYEQSSIHIFAYAL